MKMQEISFMAWDKENHVMCDVVEIVFPINIGFPKTVVLRHGGRQYSTNSTNCILLQFTGYIDKNGKKIHVEDILKPNEPFMHNFSVIWYKYGFSLTLKGGYYRDFKDAESMEIIGNIYENPELLK